MHLLNIKKKLPAKEAEEFEDLITNVHVEMKCQEWIQKMQKIGARLPQNPKDGHNVCEGDIKPNKGEGGNPKYCDVPEDDEKPDKSDVP